MNLRLSLGMCILASIGSLPATAAPHCEILQKLRQSAQRGFRDIVSTADENGFATPIFVIPGGDCWVDSLDTSDPSYSCSFKMKTRKDAEEAFEQLVVTTRPCVLHPETEKRDAKYADEVSVTFDDISNNYISVTYEYYQRVWRILFTYNVLSP